MNEWTVVGVLIALVGLYFAVHTPSERNTKENTKAMTELNMTMKNVCKELADYKVSTKETIKRIWAHNDEQDEILQDHETRLQLIEIKKEEKNNGH